MPTRKVVLTDRRSESVEKLVAEGLADLSAGRYLEIDDDGLDDYLAELGERAASSASS